MKDSHRGDRIKSLLIKLAGEFIARESSGSLITLTRILLSDDNKYATILFTVFPSESEKSASDFLARRGGEIREYIEKHARMGHTPYISFKIDEGEKNRQKIEDISQAEKK